VLVVAYLSRDDIERIAEPIIHRYKQALVPERHLCYSVDPTQLAALLGYQIEYVRITKDGSILGQTSSGSIWTTIYDAKKKALLAQQSAARIARKSWHSNWEPPVVFCN
jgi:hypothetical protein